MFLQTAQCTVLVLASWLNHQSICTLTSVLPFNCRQYTAIEFTDNKLCPSAGTGGMSVVSVRLTRPLPRHPTHLSRQGPCAAVQDAKQLMPVSVPIKQTCTMLTGNPWHYQRAVNLQFILHTLPCQRSAIDLKQQVSHHVSHHATVDDLQPK